MRGVGKGMPLDWAGSGFTMVARRPDGVSKESGRRAVGSGRVPIEKGRGHESRREIGARARRQRPRLKGVAQNGVEWRW